MNPLHRLTAVVGNAALAGALLVAVLFMLLGALGFLIGGFYLWMADLTSPDVGAAVTGGALILLAAIFALVGGSLLKRRARRQPSFVGSLGGTIGLAARLIGMAVRNDPKKALILSLVAGALAEYVASDRKR